MYRSSRSLSSVSTFQSAGSKDGLCLGFFVGFFLAGDFLGIDFLIACAGRTVISGSVLYADSGLDGANSSVDVDLVSMIVIRFLCDRVADDRPWLRS